jgi:phosphatidylinositol alpha-1,6-mannosyltransferase
VPSHQPLSGAITLDVAASGLQSAVEPARRPDEMMNSTVNGHGLLLLSELYPPAIGGSAVLFGEIYSRLGDTPVTVLSEGVGMADYGIRNPRALWQYLRLAMKLRVSARRASMIHCGRALPEGFAAWLCRRSGGPRYACWAHGEEIATALTSRELTWLMRRVYAGADVIFANSLSTRRMLEELGVAADRLELVYPGVDTQRFRPDIDATEIRRRIAPGGEMVLLSVGRLQTRKGHDLMIQAVGHLTRQQHRSLRYVIVGDGAERARLEALVDQCGVREYVTFIGEAPAQLLPQYYAACDIFVHPNRVEQTDVEGFGMVFLEAAATGKPTVGGNSGGVPEAMADGVTGLLVGGTDVEELATTVARLMDSDALRRRLGEAGRTRAVREFGWDCAAERVSTVHKRLVNKYRRATTIIDGDRAATASREVAP